MKLQGSYLLAVNLCQFKLRGSCEAGMKGVGRQYMGQIEQASAESGLSSEQVMVCINYYKKEQ